MSQNAGQTILFDVNGSERLVGELYRHVAKELVVFDDAFDEPHVWPESLDALPDLEAVSELVVVVRVVGESDAAEPFEDFARLLARVSLVVVVPPGPRLLAVDDRKHFRSFEECRVLFKN